MYRKTADKKQSKRKSIWNVPMMILAIVIVLGVLPLGYYLMEVAEGLLADSEIRMTPNINDGYRVAEFEDPAGDLLRAIPSGISPNNAYQALDIRRFSVKRIEFSPLAGVGIKPRINLVFHFDGKLPNPHGSAQGFSIPVIHVYIDAPDVESKGKVSEKTANVKFSENTWDYQVIIDGLHELPRIFSREGELLANGSGLYVNYEPKEGVKPISWIDTTTYIAQDVKFTRITAALPLKFIGDPTQGEWDYYVVVGLADLRNPSMVYPAAESDSVEIFDMLLPPHIETKDEIPVRLYPLKIEN